MPVELAEGAHGAPILLLRSGGLALAPWVSLFPSRAIVLAVLAFNIIGDGLRDALDPRAEVR